MDTVTGQQANLMEESDPELRLIEGCRRLSRLLGPLIVPDSLAETPQASADSVDKETCFHRFHF